MDNYANFDEYLADKLIDSIKFKNEAFDQYEELKIVFDQVHPDSFTAQKLFLINPIRLKYQLKVEKSKEILQVKPKIKLRPKIKR